MVQKHKTEIVCDECGAIVEQYKNWATPQKWFRLVYMTLVYRKNNKSENKPRSFKELEINDNSDPDFCSRECIEKWFKKQLDKLQKR